MRLVAGWIVAAGLALATWRELAPAWPWLVGGAALFALVLSAPWLLRR